MRTDHSYKAHNTVPGRDKTHYDLKLFLTVIHEILPLAIPSSRLGIALSGKILFIITIVSPYFSYFNFKINECYYIMHR